MACKPMPKVQPPHVGAEPPRDGRRKLKLEFGHVESLVAPIRLPATAGWARRFSSCWPPATRPERSAPRICPCAGARPAEATHGGVVGVGPLPQARVARGAVWRRETSGGAGRSQWYGAIPARSGRGGSLLPGRLRRLFPQSRGRSVTSASRCPCGPADGSLWPLLSGNKRCGCTYVVSSITLRRRRPQCKKPRPLARGFSS